MKYIFTLIWAFLITNMLLYVNSSMNGVSYHFADSIPFTLLFSVIVILIATLLPKNEVKH